jgi:hypothetical protein
MIEVFIKRPKDKAKANSWVIVDKKYGEELEYFEYRIDAVEHCHKKGYKIISE